MSDGKKKKRRFRWILKVLFYVFFFGLFFASFLHSPLFKFLIMQKLSGYLHQSYNLQLTVRNWDFSLMDGVVDAVDIGLSRHKMIYCHIPHLKVRISVRELIFNRRLEIEELIIDSVDLSVLPTHGEKLDDLFDQSTKDEKKQTVSFEKVMVHNGIIRFRDQQIPLDFKTENFRLSMVSELGGEYRELSMTLGNTILHNHGLDLSLQGAGFLCLIQEEKINILSAWVESSLLRMSARGLILPREMIRYQFIADGDVDLRAAQKFIKEPPVQVQGKLAFSVAIDGDNGNWPNVAGSISGPTLSMNRIDVKNLSADIRGRNGQFSLEKIRFQLGEQGKINGRIDVYARDREKGTFRCSLRDINLENFCHGNMVDYPINGSISGQIFGEIPFEGQPEVHFDGQIAGLNVMLPNGKDVYYGEYLEGSLSLKNKEISFQVNAAYGEGLVAGGAGRVRNGEIWMDDLRVMSPMRDDMESLLRKIAKLPPVLDQRLSRIRVEGKTVFVGSMHLKGKIPDVKGELKINSLSFAGTTWDKVHCFINLDQERLLLTPAEFTNKLSALKLNLSLAIAPRTRVESINVTVKDFPLKSLNRLLTYVTVTSDESLIPNNIQGAISGRGYLEISEEKQWSGYFKTRLDRFRYDTHSFGHLTASGDFSGETVRLKVLNLDYEHLSLDGHGSWNAGDDAFQITGKIQKAVMNKLSGLSQLGFSGTLAGKFGIKGSLKSPEITVDVGSPTLMFQGEPFGDLRFLGRLEGKEAVFSFRTEYRENYYNAFGTMLFGENPVLESSAFLDKVQIQPFLRQFGLPLADDIRGSMTGQMHLTYPVNSPENMQVSARFSEITASLRHLEITNKETLHINLNKGKLSLDDAHFIINGDPIMFNGEMFLFPLSRLHIYAKAETRLDHLQPFLTDVFPSGAVRLETLIQGDPYDPMISGQIEFTNASLKLKSPELPMTHINGVIGLTSHSLRTDLISFDTPYGEVNVTGECQLDHLIPSRWNVDFQSDDMAYPIPEGFFTNASGTLRFSGTPVDSTLQGDVWIEKSAPMSNLDLAEFVILLTKMEMSAKKGAIQDFQKIINLDVGIHGDRSLRVETDDLKIIGSVDLAVRGTLASPLVSGNLLVNSGELKFKMNRFSVDRGNVAFIDPTKIDPEIALQISSDIKDYHIKIILEGPASRLRIRLTSVPSIPQVDIVRLITTGYLPVQHDRSTQDYQASDSTAILTQVLSATVEKRLKRIIGFDTIGIDTYRTTADANPTARVTVGKQISPDLYVTYSKSVSGEKQDLVFVEYRISRRMTVVASRDEKGYLGLDFQLRKKFH